MTHGYNVYKKLFLKLIFCWLHFNDFLKIFIKKKIPLIVKKKEIILQIYTKYIMWLIWNNIYINSNCVKDWNLDK